MTPQQLRPYLRHKAGCSFYQCQQYSDGLDGQPVDCDCGLVRLWHRLIREAERPA